MTTPALVATVPPVPHLIRAHDQVADHYRKLIRRGRLKDGQEFPSIREIADEWKISTNTVYKAVRLLKDEGWIEVSQGKQARVIGVPD